MRTKVKKATRKTANVSLRFLKTLLANLKTPDHTGAVEKIPGTSGRLDSQWRSVPLDRNTCACDLHRLHVQAHTILKVAESSEPVLEEFHERLSKFTRGARLDFHEPDEQGFSGRVFGKHLDNAMGDDPDANRNELTVALIRDSTSGTETEYFNLASLIALAREAR